MVFTIAISSQIMLPVSVLQLEHGHAVASDRENLWHCGVLVLLMAGGDDSTNQCAAAELATIPSCINMDCANKFVNFDFQLCLLVVLCDFGV